VQFRFLLAVLMVLSSSAATEEGHTALAGAGQAGVERALENLRAEIERDMKLMGCRSVDQLSRDNLRWR
jgi:FMN-dependent dehydrogenase